jgi:aspartate racemase
MYQKILKDKGVKLITPNLEDQILLGNIIKETVAGDNLDRNSIEVQKISQKLLKNGAEAILEGCTEIPLIFPKQYLVSVYDSLEILASAVLKKYYLLE